MIKKILKGFGITLLVVLIVLNGFILLTGRTYLYKGMADTYFKGRSTPGIDNYYSFDNRQIATDASVQEWPNAATCNQKEGSPQFMEKNKKLGTAAFLVIRNDSVRYEHYWDGFSDTSRTNSFSMAKTVVSILAGIAIDEGKIKNVDEPVGDFLPEFKTGMNAKLTIRHLLTMSSGINFDEDYKNPLAFPAQAYYGPELEKLLYKYKVTEEPGKVFNYLSGNTAILGLVIQKATGKPISEYCSEKLWKPMGARLPALWSVDHPNGLEKAFCCFNADARDFARFGQLYLDSGRWHGKQLVSQAYVLQSVKIAGLVDDDGSPNLRYGYSWWILPEYKGHSVFYARGILGQYIIIIPDLRMIIVRLGKRREAEKRHDHPVDLFDWIDAGLATGI
ncbi:MAG TPA: serine hydrolase [Bacteroidia bacterium]|jgi:CubicO group peptidase (beta-lactamase class C family)|nr:serine hydrolase [Bacteroidia bacterium]